MTTILLSLALLGMLLEDLYLEYRGLPTISQRVWKIADRTPIWIALAGAASMLIGAAVWRDGWSWGWLPLVTWGWVMGHWFWRN